MKQSRHNLKLSSEQKNQLNWEEIWYIEQFKFNSESAFNLWSFFSIHFLIFKLRFLISKEIN